MDVLVNVKKHVLILYLNFKIQYFQFYLNIINLNQNIFHWKVVKLNVKNVNQL